MSEQGRVVWHDLMTTDIDRASEFYSELFGWQLTDVDMGSGTYRMIRSGETEIGGFEPLKEAQGAASHWLAYVTVDDVDAAAKRAQAQGGETLVPTTPIPNIGAFAVIRDQEGARISPFKSVHAELPETDDPIPAGLFCWEELLTNDPEGAVPFYSELFGWTEDKQELGDAGTYHFMMRGERHGIGIVKMPPGTEAPPQWIPYVVVNDVDADAEKVTQLGGKVLCPPMDLPGIGRFAVASDPTGGTFAVFKGN
ncbi:MAG: VOC family protein [Planctomycetota bacterium]|jgi:predicted enzyme related to lactoylglutathione lyase